MKLKIKIRLLINELFLEGTVYKRADGGDNIYSFSFPIGKLPEYAVETSHKDDRKNRLSNTGKN